MKFEIKVTGIDDAQRAIKEEQHRLERIPAEQEIPISELFPTEFLARYTQFGSLEEMFEASGFVVETAEDFDRVRGAEWDDFIRDHPILRLGRDVRYWI